ncbi:MAG: aminotransferase class I/II-fold pyridoxal phosphate-dependent enzyme, partial [Kiritimatiellae bacterium]|nr:aminotransferase class I/II-fold pyridoxal phosphate-dependent enzyme [Kiritimatiellia bacterium]
MKKIISIRKTPLPFEFPGANFYGSGEEAAALRVIRAKSPFRYYGPKCGCEVDKFEGEFAKFTGVRRALAVSSGTQALATAMSALGVGPGCEVIVPAYMWIAIVAGVVRLGAIPVLAEIDDSFTLNPAALEKRINKRTRLIVAVHMSGAPANMPAILKVARRHKVKVLEDCAQCNGGTYKGKKVGSFGDMAIFSFQLNKIMTTGEGGTITTDSEHLFRRASAIHDLGYPRINGRLVMEDGKYALWGFGGRMSEIAGAIARVQLKKLPKIIAAMRHAKSEIKKGIAGIDRLKFRRLNDARGDTGAFLILILPDAGRAKKFAECLNKNKIFAGLSPTMRVADFGMHVYYNIHSLVGKHSNSADGFPWTLADNKDSNYDYHKGAMPQSDNLMKRSVIMPIPSVMTKQDIADTIRG